MFKVSGRATDNEKALEFATVTLHTADSVAVTTTATNKKGGFALVAPRKGNYLVSISAD